MTPDSASSHTSSVESTSGTDGETGRTSSPDTNDAPRSPEELEAALREARRRVSAHIEELRGELSLPQVRVRERVREHPVAAVLGAVAVGVIAGRMLTGRAGERDRRAGDVLEHALREARARSQDGELDDAAIEEIRDRYAAALGAVGANRDTGGSGPWTGLVGSVVRSLAGRVVREGAERLLPQLIGRLEEQFRSEGRDATGETEQASADDPPAGEGPQG